MYYIVNNIYSFSYLIPTKLPSAICTIPPQLNCQLSTEDAKTKLKLKQLKHLLYFLFETC